ncbi:hypothetical protein DFJ73DRAFT_17881 [Zopfochytrium polystomum]|nr:hypothetical protein DFJ73DRAFT_17881 [Zopfochytrium polystomum]
MWSSYTRFRWLIWEFDREISIFVRRPMFIQAFPSLKLPASESLWMCVSTENAHLKELPPAVTQRILRNPDLAFDPLVATIRLIHIMERVYMSHRDIPSDSIALAISVTGRLPQRARCFPKLTLTPAFAAHESSIGQFSEELAAWFAELPPWMQRPPQSGIRYAPGVVGTEARPTWMAVQLHMLAAQVRISMTLPLAVGAITDLLQEWEETQTALCAADGGDTVPPSPPSEIGPGGHPSRPTDRSAIAVTPRSSVHLSHLAQFCSATAELVRIITEVVQPQNPGFHHLHNFLACGLYAAGAGISMMRRVSVDPDIPADGNGPTKQWGDGKGGWVRGMKVMINSLAAFGRISAPPLRMKAALDAVLRAWAENGERLLEAEAPIGSMCEVLSLAAARAEAIEAAGPSPTPSGGSEAGRADEDGSKEDHVDDAVLWWLKGGSAAPIGETSIPPLDADAAAARAASALSMDPLDAFLAMTAFEESLIEEGSDLSTPSQASELADLLLSLESPQLSSDDGAAAPAVNDLQSILLNPAFVPPAYPSSATTSAQRQQHLEQQLQHQLELLQRQEAQVAMQLQMARQQSAFSALLAQAAPSPFVFKSLQENGFLDAAKAAMLWTSTGLGNSVQLRSRLDGSHGLGL